jgi:hypothetical protein
LYYLLAYASLEVVKHIAKTSANITVDTSVLCLATLDCEIYAVSKITVVISCIADSENPTNSKPFDKVDWDLIIMTPAYNSNRYASHFRYKDTDFTKIYTCKNKTDAVDHTDNFYQEVETQYNAKIRVIYMDGETSIGPRFDIIRKRRGFTVKITALGNSAQNSSNKYLGKKFMIKSRYS